MTLARSPSSPVKPPARSLRKMGSSLADKGKAWLPEEVDEPIRKSLVVASGPLAETCRRIGRNSAGPVGLLYRASASGGELLHSSAPCWLWKHCGIFQSHAAVGYDQIFQFCEGRGPASFLLGGEGLYDVRQFQIDSSLLTTRLISR